MHNNSKLCCLVSLLFLKIRRQSSCPQNSQSLCPCLQCRHYGGNDRVVQHHSGFSWEGRSQRTHSLPVNHLYYCHTQPFHCAFQKRCCIAHTFIISPGFIKNKNTLPKEKALFCAHMDSKFSLKFCMCFQCCMSYLWDNFYSYKPSSQFSVHPSLMHCEPGSWILLWPLRSIKFSYWYYNWKHLKCKHGFLLAYLQTC